MPSSRAVVRVPTASAIRKPSGFSMTGSKNNQPCGAGHPQPSKIVMNPACALPAAYLAIFAVGVLYLRVTVNIPPEGDDKLTQNLWLYDFQRMPFWQYALQDLQGRLRYFTLQEVRFFPFHYPNAVDLLFYTSQTTSASSAKT